MGDYLPVELEKIVVCPGLGLTPFTLDHYSATSKGKGGAEDQKPVDDVRVVRRGEFRK